MNILEKAKTYNCIWLKDYIKKLKKSDKRNYIRLKFLVYYYPNTLSLDSFQIKECLSFPRDSYICLGAWEERLPMFDKFYKEIHGKDFEPSPFGETEFLSLEEFFKIFNI